MSFDDWKLASPDEREDVPTPCVVCTGHEDAPPCSESCEFIVQRSELKRQIRDLYQACRAGMRLVRRYRAEEGKQGGRELDVLAQMQEYRAWIRARRSMMAFAARRFLAECEVTELAEEADVVAAE